VPPEAQTLVAATLLAEHLTRRREGLEPERDWLDHGERALRWLAIGPAELEEWDEPLQLQLDAV